MQGLRLRQGDKIQPPFEHCKTHTISKFGYSHLATMAKAAEGKEEREGARTRNLLMDANKIIKRQTQDSILGYVQICRKICGLGCVTRTLVRALVTKPSPCIFLHFCRWNKISIHEHSSIFPRKISDIFVWKCVLYTRGL